MNLSQIAKDIISSAPTSFVLSRSFIDSSTSKSVIKRFNELSHDFPEYKDTIISLSLYPALKWALKSKNIHEVMREVEEDEAIIRLESIQKTIVDVTGLTPNLVLENRTRYFDACQKLIDIIDLGVNQTKLFPDYGEYYGDVLLLILGVEDELAPPSPYMINRYIKGAVRTLYECIGTRASELLNIILTDTIQTDSEQAFVYHNVTTLLKEFNRIVWKTNHSDDKAMKILQCKTEEEMLAIAKSDDVYAQAYRLVEYIRFIKGAIEAVKTFPFAGDEYYRIINAIIEDKPRQITDSNIASKLDMSAYNYSIKRRRALAVLSSVLWGYDGDSFITLLTEE